VCGGKEPPRKKAKTSSLGKNRILLLKIGGVGGPQDSLKRGLRKKSENSGTTTHRPFCGNCVRRDGRALSIAKKPLREVMHPGMTRPADFEKPPKRTLLGQIVRMAARPRRFLSFHARRRGAGPRKKTKSLNLARFIGPMLTGLSFEFKTSHEGVKKDTTWNGLNFHSSPSEYNQTFRNFECKEDSSQKKFLIYPRKAIENRALKSKLQRSSERRNLERGSTKKDVEIMLCSARLINNLAKIRPGILGKGIGKSTFGVFMEKAIERR